MNTIEFYGDLLRIRKAEEKIAELYPRDEMKTPMHMSMGQEAVSVALAHGLGAEDRILGSYRTHALYLARTRDLTGFFGEMFGRVSGPSRGRAGSMHLARPDQGFVFSSAVVASQIPVALGVAYAQKTRGGPGMTAVVFGDGAMEEGAFWESVNAACVLELPVLFLCEDNGWAVHTPPKLRQGFDRITEVMKGFRLRVVDFETTDVMELHSGMAEVISAVREERRPAFARAACYRYLEHVGTQPDFKAGYRSESEFKVWLARDPLKLQRERLLRDGVAESEITALETRIQESVNEAATRAAKESFPDDRELEDHLWA